MRIAKQEKEDERAKAEAAKLKAEEEAAKAAAIAAKKKAEELRK